MLFFFGSPTSLQNEAVTASRYSNKCFYIVLETLAFTQNEADSDSLHCTHVSIYIYIYICILRHAYTIHTHIYTYICIPIYTYKYIYIYILSIKPKQAVQGLLLSVACMCIKKDACEVLRPHMLYTKVQ